MKLLAAIRQTNHSSDVRYNEYENIKDLEKYLKLKFNLTRNSREIPQSQSSSSQTPAIRSITKNINSSNIEEYIPTNFNDIKNNPFKN